MKTVSDYDVLREVQAGLGLSDLIDGACVGCKRPVGEVGELKIYPPSKRIMAALTGVRGDVGWCGTCAVRKAVADAKSPAK